MNEVYRTPYYLDAPGNKLHQPFSDINQLASGITSGVTADVLNLLSGLSVSAAQLNYATSFPASCAYAVSASTAARATTADNAHYASLAGTAYYASLAGTAAYASLAGTAAFASVGGTAAYASLAGALSGLTVTASILNTVLYGSSLYSYVISSIVASDAMTTTHGLTSGFYCFVNAHTGGVIAGGYVSGGTGITFRIQANAGMFFVATSATVDFIVIGR